MNFYEKIVWVDHQRIKIIGRLAVSAQFEINLGAGVRGREDFGDQEKAFRIALSRVPSSLSFL
jgi:hypothetical protein